MCQNKEKKRKKKGQNRAFNRSTVALEFGGVNLLRCTRLIQNKKNKKKGGEKRLREVVGEHSHVSSVDRGILCYYYMEHVN